MSGRKVRRWVKAHDGATGSLAGRGAAGGSSLYVMIPLRNGSSRSELPTGGKAPQTPIFRCGGALRAIALLSRAAQRLAAVEFTAISTAQAKSKCTRRGASGALRGAGARRTVEETARAVGPRLVDVRAVPRLGRRGTFRVPRATWNNDLRRRSLAVNHRR